MYIRVCVCILYIYIYIYVHMYYIYIHTYTQEINKFDPFEILEVTQESTNATYIDIDTYY